jgi:hypothetical protein
MPKKRGVSHNPEGVVSDTTILLQSAHGLAIIACCQLSKGFQCSGIVEEANRTVCEQNHSAAGVL